MKLRIFFLLVVLFMLHCLSFADKIFAAGQCGVDYGGICANSCGSGGTVAVEGKFLAFEGAEIGCPENQYCCVKTCTSQGGSCLDDDQKTSCNKTGEIFDCENGNLLYGSFCCMEDKCAAAGSGYSCKMTSECTSPTGNTELNNACQAIESGSVCCKNDPTQSYCDSYDPNYYYCTEPGQSCTSGYTKSPVSCKDPQAQCCKKNESPGGGGGSSNTASSTPSGISVLSDGFSYFNALKVNTFTGLIFSILTALQGVVGWVAVIMIVIGGIVYITSAGSTGQVNLGRGIITWALVGFAIAVAGPSLLKEIYDLAQSGGSGVDVIDKANPIQKIVINVMNFLLMAVGIIATIGFVLGGILYVTAAGNSSQAESAKNAVRYSIYAICLSGSGLLIVKQILVLINGTR
jgi:hypothetical protein